MLDVYEQILTACNFLTGFSYLYLTIFVSPYLIINNNMGRIGTFTLTLVSAILHLSLGVYFLTLYSDQAQLSNNIILAPFILQAVSSVIFTIVARRRVTRKALGFLTTQEVQDGIDYVDYLRQRYADMETKNNLSDAVKGLKESIAQLESSIKIKA